MDEILQFSLVLTIMNEEKKIPVPKWLEDLQQKSWEPEILLSGIVLYGMFKVPELLDGFQSYYKLNIHGNSNDIDNLIALFKTGIYWLITGLIMHLICRGIWIGMVGLSYTFPKGIQMEKIHYKEPFASKVRKTPAFEQIVIRLEKVSSALFSISFMLFMSLIGGYLFVLFLIVIPFSIAWLGFDMGFEGTAFEIFQVYVLTVFSIGILGLIDFVSLGYFRKFQWIAKLYWPFHRLISFLTLSRFYRPIYYGMVTNFNKWVFFAFLLTFSFGSIVITGSMTDGIYPGDNFSRLEMWDTAQGYSVYAGYYDDQNAEFASVRAHIPSDIIREDVLRLFVVANISYEDEMLEYTPLDSLRELYPDTTSAALETMVVDRFFQISIDEAPVLDNHWYFHYKNHTKQRGFITYIDISDLDEGMHKVEVKGPKKVFDRRLATILFYRDVTLKSTQQKTESRKSEDKDVDFQPKPFGIRE